MFLEDTCFYFSHRSLHTPWLYGKIHKVHHTYNHSISFTADYAHPLEFLFGNIVPVSMGTLVLGEKIHLFTFAAFIAWK